jgi:predicted PurR-regulated permease PerM
VIINPLHKRLTKNIDFSTKKGRILKSLFAGIFSLGTAVLILLPILFVMFQITKQMGELVGIAQGVFKDKPTALHDFFSQFAAFISDISAKLVNLSADEIEHRILDLMNKSVNNIFSFSTSIVKNIGTFIISLIFMVFCLFFFYLDGAYLSNLFLNIFPIKQEYVIALVKKFKEIIKNLFLGYIMVAIVQTILAYIVFSIFRINGALVFASIKIICLFIPMFGGAIVWLPLGISIILSGNFARGALFLAVSGVFISLLDNIFRPLFLQDRIQLHPLIIFFAIMGGVRAFGFNGIILGPIIVILFLTVLDMFLTEHNIEHHNTNLAGD